MKITINHDVLADAITWTARALPQRPSVPVLAGIMLNATEQGLNLSAFDYDTSARTCVDAHVAEPGRVLVSGRLLADIVKALPHKPVQLTLEGPEVALTCGPSEFGLLTMPADDYPTLPAIPDPVGTIDADILREAINQVTLAAAKDDTLPMLTGVRIDITDDRITMAATDRYRLAVRVLTWEPEKPDTPAGVLIPARTLHDLAKSFRAGPVTVGVTDSMASFTNDGRTITIRLLDPEFPTYEKFFNGEYPLAVAVDVGPLSAAIKRVAIVAERGTPIRLAFSKGFVRVHAGSGDSRGREELPVDYDGDPIELGYQPNFLIDALTGIRQTRAHLAIKAPDKPTILTGDGDTEHRHLLMPIRLSS